MPTATLVSARATSAPAGRAQLVAQALSLSPLMMLAAVALAPDQVRRALLQPEPGLLGLPVLALILATIVVWTLAGLLVVRHVRSPLAQALALVLFTIPATVAAVVWPLVLVGVPASS
jgi:hypothetical protein